MKMDKIIEASEYLGVSINTPYMRKYILEGEIDMAERVLYLIKEQELKIPDGMRKEDN